MRSPADRELAELSAPLERLAASTGSLQRTYTVYHMRSAGYDTDSDVPGETPLPRQARLPSTCCCAVTPPLPWLDACAAVKQPARHFEHADCVMLSVVDSTRNSANASCTQDDLLAALTGDRASDLDRKFAATPIIQKLLLADGAMNAHVYVHKCAAGDTLAAPAELLSSLELLYFDSVLHAYQCCARLQM